MCSFYTIGGGGMLLTLLCSLCMVFNEHSLSNNNLLIPTTLNFLAYAAVNRNIVNYELDGYKADVSVCPKNLSMPWPVVNERN
jgi:hypothetical protein